MKRSLLPLAALLLGVAPAGATSYYLSPDVPTDLSGNTYLPWEIVRNDSGIYTLELALPPNVALDAIHPMCNGNWLLSVEVPTELPPGSGTFFDPRDVIEFSAGVYNLFFDGAASGVPPGSNVDGVFLDGGAGGDLVVGFDVPTTVGAATYDPADLVRYSGGAFSLLFDASATAPPIPSFGNVTGADQRYGDVILGFDVPTTLGPPTFLPGELASWDGATFTSYYFDAGWPLSSRDDGLALLPGPGSVPTIRVNKSTLTPGDLTISWTVGTSPTSEDYGIYEGTLGSWYSHTAIDCNDLFADLQEDVTPLAVDTYYLVVPLHPDAEGLYGPDSSGSQRPRGFPSTCRVQQDGSCP